MPPKKIVEKARVKPQQVKEPKGVRKKPNAPTVPPKRRRKPPNVNYSPNDGSTPSEAPKAKPRATLRRKKTDQNAIEDAAEMHPSLNECPKNTKSPQTTIKNESQTSIEESPNNCHSPVTSPRKKGKSKQKENMTDIKIMLANEVVRTAFQKKPIKVNVDLNFTPPCEETKVKAKRGRPKLTSVKLLEYVTAHTNPLENDETVQAGMKKKLVKSVPKKRPATDNSFVDEGPQSENTANDPIGDTYIPKKKKRLSLKRKIVTDSPTTETKDTKALRKKGTEECGTPTNITPTPNSALGSVPETNGIVQSDKINTAGVRKGSVTSTSTCLSWTRDISSSSAHSLETVQSHDFVRIDKKLPIVKLTNIDHIRPKTINNNIFDDENSENRDKASECTSNVSTLNLNVSQTLNLSTSSLTSVTTNRTAATQEEKNKDNVVSKIRQSLDNLSSKMKNIDLEMINWIGYNNEIKDETTVEYHKRVFDLLKEENEIMNYCREIKKVLLGNVDQEKEINKIEEKIPKELTPEPSITNEIESPTPVDVLSQEDENTRLFGLETIENNVDHTDSGKDNSVTEKEKPNNITDSVDDRTPAQTNTIAPLDHIEDEDAISLFAESITCLETSKRNCSLGRRSFDAVNTEENDASLERHPRGRTTSNNFDDFEDGEVCEDDEPPIPNRMLEKNTIDLSSLSHKNHERNVLDTPSNNVKTVTPILFNRFNFSNNNKPSESDLNNTSPFKVPLSFSKKFEFQNIQIKVPVRTTDVSPSRQYELVGAGRSPETITSVNKRPIQETSSNKQINNVSIERSSILGADNSGFLCTNGLNQSVQPPSTAPKQFQFKATAIFTCCIFNLSRKCRKGNCPYPHMNLDADTVSSKLLELYETDFMKELTYVQSWPILMIKYGMCFVKECVRRKLTNLLLRFNVVFITYINHVAPVVEVVESTLLYLNDVELGPLEELLKRRVGSVTRLCDYYMKIISETQNFSRFKSVFIKLTMFICNMGGTFSLSVATQLLERVCILGYENMLAAALIKILKNADPEIFNVAMMSLFERRLCSNNPQLYELLISLKVQLGLPHVPVQPLGEARSPCRTPTATSTPIAHASPDASKDSTSNSSEPVITQTVTFNHNIQQQHKMAAMNMTSGSDTSEEPVKNTFEPRVMQQRWRNHPPGFFPLRPPGKMFQRRFQPRAYSHAHQQFRRPPPPSGC